MKRIKFLVVLLCLLCAINSKAESQIKVGVLASLTGNWAGISKNIQEGIILAEEEINANGGVLNQKISFEFQDTDEEKSGAKVVNAYRYFRTKGIHYFLGPTGVPGMLALTPIAKNDDIVLLEVTAKGDYQKASPRFFNAGGDTAGVSTVASAKRAYDQGLRNIAIFGSLQPWEEAQARSFERAFSILPGAKIVSSVYPQADQADMRVEAMKLISAKPDGIFFALYNQVAAAASALQKLKYQGRKFCSSLDSSHLVGSDGGLEGAEVYLYNQPGADFVTKYNKRFGRNPELFADMGYDGAVALVAGLKAAKVDNPKEVANALTQVKFIGSSGNEHFFSQDRLINRGISLHAVENGAVTP